MRLKYLLSSLFLFFVLSIQVSAQTDSTDDLEKNA